MSTATSKPLIPNWLVNVTYYSWRFVAGAFGGGEKVRTGEPFRICGPFWLSLLGLTIGLPVVLFGWAVRLVFGKGRAKRLGNFLDSHIKGIASFCASALVVTLGLALYFWWWGVLTIYIMIAIAVGVLFGGVVVSEALGLFFEKVGAKMDELWEPRFDAGTGEYRPGPIGRLFRAVGRGIKFVVKAPFVFLRFVGLMLRGAYKRFCPIVVKE